MKPFRLFRLLLFSFPWARSPFRTRVQGRVAGNPLPTVAATGRALICSRSSDVKTRAVVPWRESPRGTEFYPLSGPGHLPRGPAQMPTCLDGTRAATPWHGLSRRTNSTHSPAPDACPVARLDLRKTGRKQQDSGRRRRREYLRRSPATGRARAALSHKQGAAP